MSLTVQFGSRSLLSLGVGIADIASLFQHGRTFGNWLRTSQNDRELFESISEVYGEVLRRRGLVDVPMMDHLWAAQWNFIYRGREVHETIQAKDMDGQHGLPGFSWFMVSLVTALDICLTTTLMRSFLADLFVKILDRDDVAELSEALTVQLHANIESWRSTGCIRGMVIPVATAVRECRSKLTGGEEIIPQLNKRERDELLLFLVWLMAGSTNQFQLLSATCYAMVAGLKAAGIFVELGDSGSESGSRPTVFYADSIGLETGLQDAIGMETDTSLRSVYVLAPQRCTFEFGKPEQMIECLPRSIRMRNKLANLWQKGAEAAAEIEVMVEGNKFVHDLDYKIGSYNESVRRWPTANLILAEGAFPVKTDAIYQAIDDFTGGDASRFHDWIAKNVWYGDSKVEKVDYPFTESELDDLLCYQALAFGFWYRLLGGWIISDYVQKDVLCSGVWGWREARLLSKLERLNNKFRKTGSATRAEIVRTLAMMFAGRAGKPFEAVPEGDVHSHRLMAVLGGPSIISLSLLRLPQTPEGCTQIAIVSLPILDLLGNQDGELYSLGSWDGPKCDKVSDEARTVAINSPRRSWSVHPKLSFFNGQIEGVSMIARCGGVLVSKFCPVVADNLLVKTFHRCDRKNSDDVKEFWGLEITEEDFQKGSIPKMASEVNPQVHVIQSKGSPAMRYAAMGEFARIIDPLVHVLCDNCDPAVEMGKLPCKYGTTYGTIIT